MRMHIELDEDLMAQVDALAGPRGRSSFVRAAVERAVREQNQDRLLEAAAGALAGTAHAWDADPAGWVRDQRRGDDRRVG